jgi:DNA-binding LacI/PurR family transcriptional regulator
MAVILSKPSVDRVASSIREDIRSRGLMPGNRYLTTAEVAENFGVAKATANRAMQVLASDGLLVRRPKTGTFVGDAARPLDTDGFDVVHLVIEKDYFETERSHIERRMSGVIDGLDGGSLQYTFVPKNAPEAFLERVINSARNSGLRHGFLVGLKAHHLQNILLDSGLPCVLLGSVFPGRTRVASIDLDQAEIGRLTVAYACRSGAQRIALLLRSSRGYGDDLLSDAAMHEAVSRGMDPGGLLVRSVPSDASVARAVVRQILDSPDRPDALICRSHSTTRHVLECIGELGLRIPDDILVVLADPVDEGSDLVELPHIWPARDDAQEGLLFAELLQAQALDAGVEPGAHIIPVRLGAGQKGLKV